MQIVLTQEDIEKLIRKSYSGIKAIKISSKNLKVSLDVDIEKFKECFNEPNSKQINKSIPIPPKPIERKPITGIMESGGVERNIVNIG